MSCFLVALVHNRLIYPPSNFVVVIMLPVFEFAINTKKTPCGQKLVLYQQVAQDLAHGNYALDG